MTRSYTRFLLSCLAAVLSACTGGAGNVAPTVSSAAPATHERGRTSVAVRIRIPRDHRRARGARYVSAATKGMTLAVTGASTLTQAIDLTPNDPRCTGTPLVCTIAIALAPGAYTAAVATYDQAPVGGAIPAGADRLSIALDVPFTVTPQHANDLDVTLDGVPASIAVGPLPNGTVGAGFASPRAFAVQVKDAGGYTIVGTYSTPITVTDGDVSGDTSIATSGSDHPPAHELLSSSDTATLAYNGKAISGVTIGAAAGSITGGAVFDAYLPFYVSDTTGNAVKLLTGGCTAASCGIAVGSGFSHPAGIALDASGNLYVADFLNNAVKEVPADGGTIRTLGSGFNNPAGVAVDSAGDVFVSDNGNFRVKEIVAVDGVIPASPTIATLGGFTSPFGIALDSSGDLFVADAGSSSVREIEAVDGVIPVSPTIATIGSGFNGPAGVAVDTAGDVFVTDLGNHAVKEVVAGGNTILTLSSALSEPYGIAIDAAGNVYVSDDLGGSVTKFAAVNGSIPAAPVISTFADGFAGPTGIAVPR